MACLRPADRRSTDRLVGNVAPRQATVTQRILTHADAWWRFGRQPAGLLAGTVMAEQLASGLTQRRTPVR